MVTLPTNLTQFLDSVIAVLVATADARLKPEVTRGWGVRVLEDGQTVAVSIDRLPAARTLENLRSSDRVAIACIRPDFTALQLKGRLIATIEPDNVDTAHIAQHRQTYVQKAGEFDIAEQVIRHHWSDDVVTLHCRIEEVFNQTPGPGAGGEL